MSASHTAEPPEPQPDLTAAVLAAFRRGEVDALGQVYDRYARPVWSVALAVLHDRALAEDATQETFLRAWRAAGSYDSSRPLGPWLLTIARRTAVDVRRRESRPTIGGHAVVEDGDSPVDDPGVEAAWLAWEVRGALEALPEEERVVVKLAHFGALTQSEVAGALGIPVGTVKSRSHRAHRRLVRLLHHVLDPPGARTSGEPRSTGQGGTR